MPVKLLQSCLTLRDPMDCSPPGSSVHGILQARILEWVAMSFSRASSRPRDPTRVSHVSCTGRQVLHHCTTWEARQKGFLLTKAENSLKPGTLFPLFGGFATFHKVLNWRERLALLHPGEKLGVWLLPGHQKLSVPGYASPSVIIHLFFPGTSPVHLGHLHLRDDLRLCRRFCHLTSPPGQPSKIQIRLSLSNP